MYIIDRDDKNVYENAIGFTQDLFMKIREKYGDNNGRPLSVLKEGGFLFNVIWEEEFYYLYDKSNVQNYCCNFSGELLIHERDVLDFTFIDRFTELYFKDINEFSWHIAMLLKETRPQIRLWTADKNAGFFGELFSYTEPENIPGGSIVFSSGHDVSQMNIYSLMITLTWSRIRHYNTEYKYDDAVLVIDFSNPVIGFGDMMRMADAYIKLCRIHGYIPLVHFGNECQFSDHEGEDCWSKFFEPVSHVKYEELSDHRCWISVHENRKTDIVCNVFPFHVESFENESVLKWKLNEKTEKAVKKRIPRELFGREKILGAVVRTTDFEKMIKSRSDLDAFIGFTKSRFKRDGYRYIFVACEDKNVLAVFKEAFGSSLLYVDQKRVDYDPEKNTEYISAMFARMYGSKYEFGVDYLSAVMSLTYCSTVIFNRMSGAVYLAENAVTESRQKISFVWAGCLAAQRFYQNYEKDRIYLYGAGINGRDFGRAFKGFRGETVYCDKKAENGEYSMKGCRVISVKQLAEEYSGEDIIITPAHQRNEIKKTLLNIGIEEKHIITDLPVWRY